MATAGPGDLVEALYDIFDARLPGCRIERGKFYVVETLAPVKVEARCSNGHWGLTEGYRLAGVYNGRTWAWCPKCFRPIGRPAQGLINSINQWIAEGAPLKEGEIA